MSSAILELKSVQTHIGAFHILYDVTLAVPKGGVTVLMGRNGAGKTTTLRTVMGLWHSSAGTITYKGRDIHTLDTSEVARLGIAYVPENMGIFSQLTVQENLLLAARSTKKAKELAGERLDLIFQYFPAIKKFWRLPAGHLSGGQKQMVAIARAIIEPCDLLIVDEPSKGLSPAMVATMVEAFSGLKNSGVSILLVEQNVAFAKHLGDCVAVMDEGRIAHVGSMGAFIEDLELQHSLLGLAL